MARLNMTERLRIDNDDLRPKVERLGILLFTQENP